MVRAYWYINFFNQIWQNNPAYSGWRSTGGDTFRIVLLGPGYTPNQDTHVSAAHLSNEVSGQGYNTGGQILTGKTISVDSGALVLGADDATWVGCVFSFRWAAIYDDTNTQALQKQLVRFVDFEQTISLQGDTLRLKFDGQGVIVDITPPVDDQPPVLEQPNIDGQLLTMPYNEPLKTASVPATSAFQVLVDSLPRTVSSVAMGASSVILTVSPAVISSEVVTVSYIAPAVDPIQDLASNLAETVINVTVDNITLPGPPPDVIAPVLQSATINGTILILTYDEVLNTASVPLAISFAVFYSGIGKSIQSVSIQDTRVIIVMSVAAIAANIVTLNYTAGANPIEDQAGNNAANLSGQSVTNQTPGDSTAPVLTNLTVNGMSLVLTYNEALITSAAPAAASFLIRVSGNTRSLNNVVMAQFTVTLTLSSPVASTDAVVASYTAPLADPIRDLATNLAPNFANLPVTNTTPPATPTDLASFVSQSVPSLVMDVNTTQNVTVTMRNDGTAVWSGASGYHLYSQNPAGNNNWGIVQVPVAGNILGGANAVFSYGITAPSTPATYNFQWRMRHTTTEFGGQTTNVAIVVSQPPPPTGEFFVAKTGSDGANGSSATPFLTVNRGLQALSPGGTLTIRAGTYTEGININAIPSGISDLQHTTVRADTGAVVTLNGRSTNPASPTAVLWIYSRSFITLQDIIFDAASCTGNGVYIGRQTTTSTPSTFIRMIRCTVRNTPDHSGIASGFNQDGSVNCSFSFIDCIATDNGNTAGGNLPHGLYLTGQNNLVDGGEFYNNAGHGIHGYAHDITTGNNGTIIRNTKCYGNGSYGIGAYNGSNYKVYNNVVYRNGLLIAGSGGMSMRFSGTGVCYNNTAYGNTGIGINLTSSGNVVRNNIAYQNTSTEIAPGSGNTLSNNIQDPTNPLFVNAAADNFHLQAGSPAINAGFDVSSTLTTDHDGVIRSAPFDCGAYEFV